ncbi:MAG: aspartate/glutamate racemase family protein [Actinobacteria bacterium]|nr:aspartate/glutamate racemase family protein [Actinomycetota bacterium]
MDTKGMGYVPNFEDLNVDVSVPKGQAVAGSPIGILVLDLQYPYIPGNVANASTYNFPVRYKVLKGTTIPQILSHDSSLLDLVIEGGKELEKDGVRAIVGACGYFGYYQKKAAAALNVPVFLSSLLQVPIIKNALKPNQKVGVICADYKALSPEVLRACGADPSDIVITGAQDLPEFQNILKCTGHYNPTKLKQELVGLSKRFVAENPNVGAILLECSDMPPFALSVQNATGLPVFDFITLINWIYSAVVRRPFGGFM